MILDLISNRVAMTIFGENKLLIGTYPTQNGFTGVSVLF